MSETRDRLLDVAERLFAQAGIEKVSMREVVRESGHHNQSAAQYHFGSRDAMIATLIERRMHVINQIRHARLDEAVAANAGVRDLLFASVDALAEAIRDHPWGVDFVQVSAQALFSPQVELARRLPREATSSLHRFGRLLRARLPELAPAVLKARLRIVNNQATYAFADWVRVHGPVRPSNLASFTILTRDTTDFLAGGLMAPVGASTAAPLPADRPLLHPGEYR